MNSKLIRRIAACVLLLLLVCRANAALIVVEPDSFAAGTDLRTAFPGVNLSVQGKPGVEVRAVDSFSPFNGRRLASTGTLVFGQFPLPSVTVPQGWDENLGLLRADFASPADFVQIDLIFDDDDIAALWAFDINGNLLAMVTASGDGRGNVPLATASISRQQGDIAYILAGGQQAEATFLDNFQVRLISVPEPTSLSLLALGLTGIAFARRRKR